MDCEYSHSVDFDDDGSSEKNNISNLNSFRIRDLLHYALLS